MGARELLSDLAGAGLSVTADGDRLVIRPASKLTDSMRVALRDTKPELMALLRGAQPGRVDPDAAAWTDADIARFIDRRARLMRWGWPEAEAEKLADRLVQRDREHDERVSCADCRHYRPGRCGNQRRAGLNAADIGRELAATLQRCPGFAELGAIEPNERSSWGTVIGPVPRAMTHATWVRSSRRGSNGCDVAAFGDVTSVRTLGSGQGAYVRTRVRATFSYARKAASVVRSKSQHLSARAKFGSAAEQAEALGHNQSPANGWCAALKMLCSWWIVKAAQSASMAVNTLGCAGLRRLAESNRGAPLSALI